MLEIARHWKYLGLRWQRLTEGTRQMQSYHRACMFEVDLCLSDLFRITNCMVCYGLSLNAGNLGGDRYISFSLSGLIEIPSAVLMYFLINRYSHSMTVAESCNSGIHCISKYSLSHWKVEQSS